MADTCSEATATGQDPNDNGGQIVHRFVNNFHIHQNGERIVCGNCGDEKVCLRCSNVGKKQCEVCGIWLSSHPTALAYHQLVHSRERTFKCNHCPASFARNYVLQCHMRTHTREMPYLCEICGLQFRRSHHLIDHQAAIHSDRRPFDCNSCGRTFKLRYQLMQHKRKVHKFAYMCPECKESFGTRNEFSEHHAAVHAMAMPDRGPPFISPSQVDFLPIA